MKSNIFKIVVVLAVVAAVLLGYRFYQDSQAWVVSYEVVEGRITIEATSPGSEKLVYTGSVTIPEIKGTWDTSRTPPQEIEVVFSDYTIQPGRVVFSLNGEQFDLMQRGLFHVEPK